MDHWRVGKNFEEFDNGIGFFMAGVVIWEILE